MNTEQREIILVPYNPAWPQQFAEEAAQLYPAFWLCWLSIFHIGSTAIPGLLAKPTLDLMLVVRDINKVDTFQDALSVLNYFPKGEYGIPGRRYFHQGDLVHRTHLHVFEEGSDHIERHLLFRDYLRAHEEAANAYSALKMSLLTRYRYDPAGYTDAKHDFIQTMELQSQAWKLQSGWQLPAADWIPTPQT